MKGSDQEQFTGGPMESKSGISQRFGLLRGLLFAGIVLYVLISFFHAPVLAVLGRFLVVQHSPEKGDLIVCLAGAGIERGLASADAYQKGLAPYLFIAREEPPDGMEILREKRVPYPESIDLLFAMLKGLGVPESALLTSEIPSDSTYGEASMVRDLAKQRGYRTIILITSPTHSRRAWTTFRKVMDDEAVRFISIPTPYSKFDQQGWWKDKKYVKEVFIEYQKLIYYSFKYFV